MSRKFLDIEQARHDLPLLYTDPSSWKDSQTYRDLRGIDQSPEFRLRTVTLGTRVEASYYFDPIDIRYNIGQILTRLAQIVRNTSEKYGIGIDTTRLTLPDIGQKYTHEASFFGESPDELEKDIFTLDKMAKKLSDSLGISVFVAPFSLNLLDQCHPDYDNKPLVIMHKEEIIQLHRKNIAKWINSTTNSFGFVNIPSRGTYLRKPDSHNEYFPTLEYFPKDAHTRLLNDYVGQIVLMGKNGGRFSIGSNIGYNFPFYSASVHNYSSNAKLSIGMAGPGILLKAVKEAKKTGKDLVQRIAEAQAIMVYVAEHIGIEISEKLNRRRALKEVKYVGTSISQAPNYGLKEFGSVSAIIEEISGVPFGTDGTVEAFSTYIKGLRKGSENRKQKIGYWGEFIPISEDYITAQAIANNNLRLSTIFKLLEICGSGLDMIVFHPDTTISELEDIILRVGEISKGNDNKPLQARVIKASHQDVDESGWVNLGGLLGRAPVYRIKYDDLLFK